MKRLVPLLFCVFVVLQFVSCSKDKSYEAPPPGHGSLLSLAGDCLNKTLKGTYKVNQALTDSNYILVNVRVTQKGSYTISTTNVLNGYSFQGTGIFADTGYTVIRLRATGVPSAAQTDRFTLLLDSSICDFEVVVVPNGVTNGTCNATVSGVYSKDDPLTAGNTVTLQHNYATAGTYNVTTDTVNGYSFKKTITVAATGNQTITLDGAGTPMAVQSDLFTVKFGDGVTCNFNVNVIAPQVSSDYFPLTANSWWSYNMLLSPPDTITRTVSGTKTITANNYTRFLEKDKTATLNDSAFYRKSSADVIEYGLTDKYYLSASFDVDQFGDILILKTGQPTGTIWNSSAYSGNISGAPNQIRYKFTVINQDASITIGGRTYNNVYQVGMLVERDPGSGFAPTNNTWLFYYAKGVGLIYAKGSVGTTAMAEYQLRNWKVF